MNGRVGKDRYTLSLTCKDTNTVDYLIVSTQCSPCIYEFIVEECNEVYFDCHRAIYIKLCGKKEETIKIFLRVSMKMIDKSTRYQNAIQNG